MNTLIAMYIWLAGALGLPTDTFNDELRAPGCGHQQTMSAESSCDEESEDSNWYFDRTTHIYNGF